MNKKKWTTLLILILAIGLILAGCAGGGDEDEGKDEPETPPAEVAEEDKFGGIFNGRLASDPPNLDPAFVTDTTSSKVANNIFDGLVEFDEKLNVVGAVAKDWDISEDGLEWTFNLRKGIKFHNGNEVKSEDVNLSFTRILDPETQSPRAWLFENVKGAEAFRDGQTDKVEGFEVLDEYTFKITLEEAFTPFLSVLAMTNASIVSQEAIEEFGEDFTSNPVGCGPFKFEEWRHDDVVKLTRFDDYYDGKPYLAGIDFRVIPENSTAFAEYEQGGIYELETIPDGQIERVLNNDEFENQLIKKPQLGIYYIGINVTKEYLKDKKVRQAINYAVNKEAIAKVLRHGTVVPAKGILPPGMPGYNKELEGYSYDQEKAKELLAEAGYPDGLPEKIELKYNTSKGHQMIAEAVQADLKKIGIDVELVNMDWGAYITKIDNGDSQLFRYGWIGDYPDPDNFLYVLFHSENKGPGGNGSFYSNPEFDELTAEARGMEPGPDRIEKYQKAEEIVIEDAPLIPIYYYTNLILRKPGVENYVVTPLGSMELDKTWIREDLREE